ncbi:MAG: ABC transporter permease [Saprospiraceae bacterium]|nr:ABC transporter permease [Saprospiraceae bacterium]
MFKNYWRIALRGLRRQPGYALLNILGLTIGVAATLFILLYVYTEMRYDRYHTKQDRIYRISSDITEPDDAFRWAVTQTPLGMQVKADFPEVEQFVRFIPNGRTQLQSGEKLFFEEDVYLVDSTLTEIFDLDFVRGDALTALKDPNSIVLSSTVANRIFGTDDPINEILKTPSDGEYKVTGVYRDFPSYSHLVPAALISTNSIDGLMNPDPGSWGGFGIYTYVLLRDGTDPAVFQNKLTEIIKNHVAVIFDQFDIKIRYELINLADIHLRSDFEGEPEPVGKMGFIYIFGAVAIFMLLIACINYMNLATARSTKRALEVGIRKVLGSERRQLVGQFLSESVIFSLVALFLSFGLVFLLLPVFNQAFDLDLSRAFLVSPVILGGALIILLLTGILGGSYPAFYLSGFRPISVLKGQLSKGTGNPQLRKVLVTVQFAITLFMIIGTGIIYDQMNYLRNKELGFDKEHLMTFGLQGRDAQGKYTVLRQELLQIPKITSVATASTSPGNGFGKQVMSVENSEGVVDEYGVDNYAVDFEFFPTMNIKFIAGRNFSREFGTDSTLAAIVNESMVKRMGWTDAIGKRIQFQGNDTLPFARVIGVVKDFHQQSLYEPISPLVFIPRFQNGQVHLKLNPQSANDLSAIIGQVEQVWNKVFPGTPFEYDFVDAAFMELYHADQVRAKIFTLFSILMIFIACLGLLGLASFTAEQRTKEIGVRKILGAETSNIVLLLTRNFVLLVALASIPAFIGAWYFMSKWLDTFSYHANLNYWLFALSLMIVILITLMTTGYHAFKAAVRNPINSLRDE